MASRCRPTKSGVLLALAAAALIALLAPPAPVAAATAPTLVDRHGKRIHGKRVRWLRQSRMPIVGGRVRIVSGRCPQHPRFSACVFRSHPRTFYIRPAMPSPKGLLYHELGHSFDVLVLRSGDRRALKRSMGLHGRGWFSGAGPPAELFAEGYALCSRFGVRRPAASRLGFTHSVYGYRPSRRAHRAVCRRILRAGARRRRGQRRRPHDTPPVIEQKPPQRAAPPPASPEPPPQRQPLLGIPGLPLL